MAFADYWLTLVFLLVIKGPACQRLMGGVTGSCVFSQQLCVGREQAHGGSCGSWTLSRVHPELGG